MQQQWSKLNRRLNHSTIMHASKLNAYTSTAISQTASQIPMESRPFIYRCFVGNCRRAPVQRVSPFSTALCSHHYTTPPLPSWTSPFYHSGNVQGTFARYGTQTKRKHTATAPMTGTLMVAGPRIRLVRWVEWRIREPALMRRTHMVLQNRLSSRKEWNEVGCGGSGIDNSLSIL